MQTIGFIVTILCGLYAIGWAQKMWREYRAQRIWDREAPSLGAARRQAGNDG